MLWYFLLKILLLLGSFWDRRLATGLPFTPTSAVVWLALFTLSLLPLLVPLRDRAKYCLFLPALLFFWPPARPLLPLFFPDAVAHAVRSDAPTSWLPVFVQGLAIVFGLRPFTIFMGLVAALAAYLIARLENFTDTANLERDRRQETILNLRQKNRYLETENQKTAELTRLAERDRISRELHDVIGHTLSSSILQLEALHVTTKDENQKRALASLRDRLSGGMDDIRKTLHKMRRESFDLEQKVRALAAEMPDRELDWSMYVTSDLSLNFRLDLLNIIQEGVTNFQKYSEADTLTVRLIEQQTFYSLEIRDPGPAKRTAATEPGIGLFSMRETAERYGGLFRRNDDRGFGVHLTFPKTEATAKE